MNPMSLRFQGLLAALLATAVTLVHADPLPRATPESVGLSGPRLERIGAMLHQWVDKKEIPGAVIMIARHGKLAYVETVGLRDAGKGAPLAEDSLFRLYSMTKPIVSIAAMSLVEEGRLAVNEPISKYLPEFKDMKVATEVFDPVTGTQIYTTAPAKRPITVQDLLRHTSGLTYGAPLNERTQVQRMYRDAGIWSQKWVLADFTKALAQLPLMYEPGTTWEYGHSTDVLGRVVEVAAGKTLDAVLAERIFQPLGMRDTAFNLPEGGVDRLAQPQPDPYTGKTPDLLDFTQHQTFFAGGHGLVGTAADYLRFVEMLVEGGTLDGTRVLGPRIVDYVASNHLHGGIALTPSYLPGPGYGFGLGFGVRLERGQSPQPGSVGDYYWGGYGGTAFWIDPKEKMVVVFMTTEPTRRNHYRAILRDLVYAAILD
ncbi:MAG: beta-lactamase family protein [Burkholderiales bacterium]|nr:beta-lactamase family protein [Burkholderiales bacterium]